MNREEITEEIRRSVSRIVMEVVWLNQPLFILERIRQRLEEGELHPEAMAAIRREVRQMERSIDYLLTDIESTRDLLKRID